MNQTLGPDGDPRRGIPATHAVLSDPRLSTALTERGRDQVKAAIHHAQQQVRNGDLQPTDLFDTVLEILAGPDSHRLRPVLNATGVIVHTNLGRAPLSQPARAALVAAAGSTDVEFDLDTGARARRGRGALDALSSSVPRAEDVHIVNNNAAALLLCAAELAAGRTGTAGAGSPEGAEIVLSRGQLVEIGDGFRVPDLLASTGARIREVGTTNRTHRADYERAIGPNTGFILVVHPSNFQVTGFTSSVDVQELTGLGVPVVVDIGSGLLAPHPMLPDEPDASSMLGAGADLVTASADKLLGGPQAGLLLGRSDLIQRLRRHPSARALRVDKLALAALEATLRTGSTPVDTALVAAESDLAARAGQLAGLLWKRGIDARAVRCESVIGGGGAPEVRLPSHGVALPEAYAAPLRTGEQPVVGRIADGQCVLDLRTVDPEQDDRLLAAVDQAASPIRTNEG